VGGQRLGSLQVQFAETISQAVVEGVFATIAPLLGLYVSMRSPVPNGHPVDDKHPKLSQVDRDADTELTPRQLRILHLLAEGMTNPQIAARIGFSDSTVRQETMAIYRFLNADGRRDAVHIAGLRGLLAEDGHAPVAPVLVGNRHAAMV
jgi:DNA-binding NarL/FixJ family response regulator